MGNSSLPPWHKLLQLCALPGAARPLSQYSGGAQTLGAPSAAVAMEPHKNLEVDTSYLPVRMIFSNMKLRTPPCRTEGSARVFADAGRPHASWVPWCHWGNEEMEAGCSFLFINLVGGVNMCQPFWKIWVRQLGIFFSTYGKNIGHGRCNDSSNIKSRNPGFTVQPMGLSMARKSVSLYTTPWGNRIGWLWLVARWCISQQFRVITWSFDEFWCCRKSWNISVNETPEVGERGETPWYKIT